MPVEDHAPSEMVKRDTYRAGCYDSPEAKDGYWGTDRKYFDDGRWVLVPVYIKHTMSKRCRQINDLPECLWCETLKDMEYILKMKELK